MLKLKRSSKVALRALNSSSSKSASVSDISCSITLLEFRSIAFSSLFLLDTAPMFDMVKPLFVAAAFDFSELTRKTDSGLSGFSNCETLAPGFPEDGAFWS